MSIKGKVFASAAALGMIGGGLGVAGVATAHASTPPCGSACVEISSLNYGPGSVFDVYKRTAKVGQKIILWASSNTDPATDFTVHWQGTVNQFAHLGLAATALKLHYGRDRAFEVQYSPYGVNSHLCVGVTSATGGAVTLQRCGVSAKTLWIVDEKNKETINGSKYAPLINGSNRNFSNPYVLSNRSGVLYTSPQNTYADGTVYDNQMWTGTRGVVQ
jgi:hypothetical protein